MKTTMAISPKHGREQQKIPLIRTIREHSTSAPGLLEAKAAVDAVHEFGIFNIDVRSDRVEQFKLGCNEHGYLAIELSSVEYKDAETRREEERMKFRDSCAIAAMSAYIQSGRTGIERIAEDALRQAQEMLNARDVHDGDEE